MALMSAIPHQAQEPLRTVVDRYRGRCLWFLRPGYYPETIEEALRVLESIERYGDREAFQRAGEVRRCLSRDTSAKSAGS